MPHPTATHDFGLKVSPHAYLRTRYIPRTTAQTLVHDAIEATRHTVEAHHPVCDLGCGPGRLLAALAANCTGSIVAVDSSEVMLRSTKCDPKLKPRMSFLQGDAAHRSLFPPRTFGIILVHWLLNVDSRWETIVGNLETWLAPGGGLLWFEEAGDLYEAVDGHVRTDAAAGWSEFGVTLWQRFYDALGTHGTSMKLAERRGLSWTGREQCQRLLERGFSVMTLGARSRVWKLQIDAEWIFAHVIQQRPFSNFWDIPDDKYLRGVAAVRDLLQRYPLERGRQMTMTYKATPILAFPS